MPFLYVPYAFLYVPLDSWALLSPSSMILLIWPICPKWPSPLRSYTFRYTFLYVPGGLSTFLLLAELLVNKHALRKYSLWGSNPRPMAHKTIALTTELRELAACSTTSPSRSPHEQHMQSQTTRQHGTTCDDRQLRNARHAITASLA